MTVNQLQKHYTDLLNASKTKCLYGYLKHICLVDLDISWLSSNIYLQWI